MSARLDWSDPSAVASWLRALRTSFHDLDATAKDMLRRPRKRELGPAMHSENYRATRAQILGALDFAGGPEPANDQGPKSGARPGGGGR